MPTSSTSTAHAVTDPHDQVAVSRSAWRRERGEAPLPDVFGTIRTYLTPGQSAGVPKFRRLAAFLGPGYLVATGYMDPGNWATALAGGAGFGYTLLSVALMANIMGVLLQSLSARLGIATGRDLAQACRDAYPAPVAFLLWILAELAIVATDLAEVIGTAIGLNLLFGIPLELGVLITALDVLLILVLQRWGFRWIEAFVLTLLVVIAVSFGIQVALASPEWGAVIRGFAPTTEIVRNPQMLYIAIGILGATVMPHNLYLHSAIVQTRRIGDSVPEKREAIKLASIDSGLALLLALFINAALLILAAATFHKAGKIEVTELNEAYALLAPMLGSPAAANLFAIALIACGLNATITATLTGQAVMQGFIALRIAPWARRLGTRLIAIVPAIAVALWYGPGAMTKLLLFSQVVLSLQLPFAMVPLVQFTGDRAKMGELVAPRWMTVAAWIIAAIVIALNAKLLFDAVSGMV